MYDIVRRGTVHPVGESRYVKHYLIYKVAMQLLYESVYKTAFPPGSGQRSSLEEYNMMELKSGPCDATEIAAGSGDGQRVAAYLQTLTPATLRTTLDVDLAEDNARERDFVEKDVGIARRRGTVRKQRAMQNALGGGAK